MLINFGRLLMLCVWAFLLLNLFQPFPKPLNIFVNVALIFMTLMHGLQLTLLKATQTKEMPPLGRSTTRSFSSKVAMSRLLTLLSAHIAVYAASACAWVNIRPCAAGSG